MTSILRSFLDWLRSLFFKVFIHSGHSRFMTEFFEVIHTNHDRYYNKLIKTELELTLVGLQNSGKTTLVNVIAVNIIFKFLLIRIQQNSVIIFLFLIKKNLYKSGQFSEDMIPTVGFNMRKVTKGSVTMKQWDIGGQPRFRSMWERYCRGVNAIV